MWEIKTEELALTTTQLQGSAGSESPSQLPAAPAAPPLGHGPHPLPRTARGPPSVALSPGRDLVTRFWPLFCILTCLESLVIRRGMWVRDGHQ